MGAPRRRRAPLLNEHEYREQLNALEEQLSDLYRRRRALTEAFADEHPPVLPARIRNRSETQMRIARCPRCSMRLDSDESGSKI